MLTHFRAQNKTVANTSGFHKIPRYLMYSRKQPVSCFKAITGSMAAAPAAFPIDNVVTSTSLLELADTLSPMPMGADVSHRRLSCLNRGAKKSFVEGLLKDAPVENEALRVKNSFEIVGLSAQQPLTRIGNLETFSRGCQRPQADQGPQ